MVHQIYFSPMHGDGALYAWLARQFASSPSWIIERVTSIPYIDHPYLFFYFSYPFFKFLPDSEWAAKAPNYIIGLATFYTTTLFFKKYGLVKVLPIFFLVFFTQYEHQTREPSLDPLTHWL
ncbi:MAG: hypothetical protein NZ480_09800, partial [Bdellovibrionaceae bacterium]|nr:hypothetical protein [Pseudobdellovibrionaceae bacterium]